MVKRCVMATLPFAFFAMGIWLVVCFVAPCIARSATQEAGTGIDARGTAQDYSHARAC